MSSPAFSLKDVAAAIRALETEFVRNANANNAAALTDGFYAEDAQLLPPNAPVIRGKSAIRDFWTAFLAAGASDLSLETGTVDASGDLAYCTGRYAFKMGGAPQDGKYVVVLRRQSDGGYKALADMFSSNA